MRWLLALLILLVPTASAAVEVTDVSVPDRTMAGKAFDASVELRNRGDASRVYLFAALYAGEGDACGPATDPRFRRFTHIVQEPIDVPAGATIRYPPPGETWLQRYEREDSDAAPRDAEWCVFVARSSTGAQLQYDDFASLLLSVRGENAAPEASFSWSPEAPVAAQDVQFHADASDAEGDPLTFAWDFGHLNASGRAVAQGEAPRHFFFPEGEYTVTLVASDGLDETRVARQVVVLPEGSVVSVSPQPARDETPLPWWLALAAVAVLAARRK